MSFRRISTFALSVFVAALLAPASQADTHWKETCQDGLDPALHWLLCGSAPSMVDECRAEWEKAPARHTCTSGGGDMIYERGKCRLSKECSYTKQRDGVWWETLTRSHVFHLLPKDVARLCANSAGRMSLDGSLGGC